MPTLADERREHHSEIRENKQDRGWFEEEMLVVTDDLGVSFFLEISHNKSDDVGISEKLAWNLYSQICFNTDTLDSWRDTKTPCLLLSLSSEQ